MINKPIIDKFFKDFTNHKKKTNRTVVFSCRPFPNILKYRDHWRELLTIWKTRLFRNILNSSASMYESSGSLFLNATFLLVCFSSLKDTNCETWKMFFISLQKLFSFSRKSNFSILDIQISWRHQMPKHETRNTFYWISTLTGILSGPDDQGVTLGSYRNILQFQISSRRENNYCLL